MKARHAALLAVVAVALIAAAVLLSGAAEAPPRLPSASVHSVFHIEKSENRNQVHYAVAVDAQCRPEGKAPVRGYWRDFEEGPKVTSGLLAMEQGAYGVTPPRSITLRDAGGEVQLSMRALSERSLRIATFREGSQCRARAYTSIKRQPSVLTSIYVEVGFLSIDYLVLRGFRLADGAAIQERIER